MIYVNLNHYLVKSDEVYCLIVLLAYEYGNHGSFWCI